MHVYLIYDIWDVTFIYICPENPENSIQEITLIESKTSWQYMLSKKEDVTTSAKPADRITWSLHIFKIMLCEHCYDREKQDFFSL